MDERINFNRDSTGVSWSPSVNSEGHGKSGDIKKSSWYSLGRSVTLLVGGDSITLNRGSVIDFLNAHRELVPEDKKFDKIGKNVLWGGPDETTLQGYLDLVTNALSVPPSGEPIQTESWMLRQGAHDFYAGNYKAAIAHLTPVVDSISQDHSDSERRRKCIPFCAMLALSHFITDKSRGYLGTTYGLDTHQVASNLEIGRLAYLTAEKLPASDIKSELQKLSIQHYGNAAHNGSKEACKKMMEFYQKGWGAVEPNSERKEYYKKKLTEAYFS